MKKLLVALFCAVVIMCTGTNVYAGELDANEKYVIDTISKKDFPQKIENRYINQLENYFLTDNVKLSKDEALDFILYFKEAVKSSTSNSFSSMSDRYISFEKAGSAIGLYLEYDSTINGFYFINSDGRVVIDFQDIIKNTDSTANTAENKSWNISVEMIFAAVIIICILGLVINLKRWNRKMKGRNQKRYEEEDEDDDELEVANRKTRKARLQTFSYNNIKQILKYCYIPIIMALIVIAIGSAALNFTTDLYDSVQSNFVNTQPIYTGTGTNYKATSTKEKEQKKTIPISSISYPQYGDKYGTLTCSKLDVKAPVYFSDRGSFLAKGAGTYIGSAVPGQGKTILIGAHDTTYFKGLEKVKKGQEFKFTTSYGIYRYKVTKTKIVSKDKYDSAYDLAGSKEQLVLYTCYPFGELKGKKTDRMFVYLDKISGPAIEY